MDEIKSFLTIEINPEKEPRKDALALNSGRSCFRYILRAFDIKNIWLPEFTCECIFDVAKEENINYKTYAVDDNFLPQCEFNQTDFILYTNYFGICNKNIKLLKEKYPNLIIDNAHGFYSSLEAGIASFNSARKFFGTADGAYLKCKKELSENFEEDISYKRSLYLLKAMEKTQKETIRDFELSECTIELNKKIKRISKLTRAILSGVDYKKAADIRLNNFKKYQKALYDINLLKPNLTDDIPMVYPLLNRDNKNLKAELEKNNIYLETYFETSNDQKRDILPLPIHQQLKSKDVEKIIKIIKVYEDLCR